MKRKTWVLITLGVVLAYAALMGGAYLLDRHEDRTRPMFQDVLRMGELQTELLGKGREVVAVDVDNGRTVEVDGHKFRPSEGVRVQVVARDDGYCVRGWNAHGDQTSWLCGDADHSPP